jgi:hypothetical protein
VVFAETGSTNNRYLYVAYVFSEGLVEGLREVFIDDWQLPAALTANLNAGQRVTVNADRYKDRVQLQWYPGAYFNNIAASPVGTSVKTGIFAEAPSFKDTMDYNGLCVLFARYEWKEIKTQEDADSNPFSGNIPSIQISLLGKRVASLVTGTPEAQNYDASSIRYSTNPAEILLDYLRNPRYGKGLTNDDIDWPSWKRAAAKCNTQVTYLATKDITGPIMTCNHVLPTDQTIFANVKTLLMGFRAYMPYVGGKYKLRIEDAGNDIDILSGVATIVATFNKDNIQGTVSYTGIEKSAKYNVVSVSYVDPDQKFSVQQVIHPETEEERQVFINRDGGRENKLDATFPTLTNYAMAKDMARLLFNKGRRQETCSFTASSQALELEPGDNIRIQSTILNFGTDPWRVVSLKINDNMTVEVACVRNPDDIYPYSRAGEEDIVLPTYVPKGSIIYFPSAFNEAPIGLVPPNSALYPDDFLTTPPGPGGPGPDNPGPSVPDVVSPNNPPVDPPPPPPFDAALTFRRTIYTKNDANTGLFTVVFNQPDAGLYDYALMWWRPNQFTAWTQVRLEAKPGPGGDITATFGPLANFGQYEYYVRAYATDGRASSNVTKGYFRAVQSQTQLGELLGTGAGSTQAVVSGWAPPESDVPEAPWYDDDIAFLDIRPKLTSSAPSSPRRMSVTLTQTLYTFVSPVNPLIDGIYVYYKYRDDEFWFREELLIPSGKSITESINWDLAGDFGAPSHPASALFSPTAFQQYDFIVRLKYKDGTTALKQMGPARAPVEMNGTGLIDYSAFGTDPRASASVRSTLIPSGFEIKLQTQQDPVLVYNTGQDLLPNFQTIRASSQQSIITWRFNPPANPRFRGYRIRYRMISPGSNPAFTVKDIGSVAGQDGIIAFDLNSDYSHSTRYEWMITALYRDNAGATVDANNCWYARAAIPFGITSGTELLNRHFNFEQKDSKTTLGAISTAFPAVAAIIPQRWVKRQLARFVSTDSTFTTGNGATRLSGYEVRRDSTGQPRLNAWFELTFQAPNQTFDNLVVYRRVFSSAGAARTTATSTLSKYYDLGAWEKVVIPRADLTHQGSGVYLARVRGPISHYVFNSTPGGTLFRSIFGSAGNYPGPGYPSTLLQLNQMYPYFGAGNGNILYTAEYLFVLDDGGEGQLAARLTDFRTDFAGTSREGFVSEVDGIQSANQPRDDYRNVSDFNTFDAGFSRNISEALTNITVFQLSNEDFGRQFPRLNASFNGWTFYLNNPTGVTVY